MESDLTDRAPALFPASLILLTYNQQSSVAAAIKAALAQECVPIEIILSDDASSDGTFEILQNVIFCVGNKSPRVYPRGKISPQHKLVPHNADLQSWIPPTGLRSHPSSKIYFHLS